MMNVYMLIDVERSSGCAVNELSKSGWCLAGQQP